ncbi:MAG: HAD family hydrolase, partial [Actinocrinis sp.]
MISTPEHPDTTPPTPAPTPTHQPTPRLVATDLDGTIVRGDGTVSARTVSALMAVRASGADFVLVTGRPPRLMAAIAAAFGHQGLAICSNGAFRYDLARETVIGQSPI